MLQLLGPVPDSSFCPPLQNKGCFMAGLCHLLSWTWCKVPGLAWEGRESPGQLSRPPCAHAGVVVGRIHPLGAFYHKKGLLKPYTLRPLCLIPVPLFSPWVTYTWSIPVALVRRRAVQSGLCLLSLTVPAFVRAAVPQVHPVGISISFKRSSPG